MTTNVRPRSDADPKPSNEPNYYNGKTAYLASASRASSFCKPLLLSWVLIMLLSMARSTEIQVLGVPSEQQRNTINMIKSLRRFREKKINLNGSAYVCVTALKVRPMGAPSSNPDAARRLAAYVSGNIPNITTVNSTVYTEDLDLLVDDVGVKQYTREFIYGYKHKKIVTQFDDETTKTYNQKKQYQNFTLGLFDVSQVPKDTRSPISRANANLKMPQKPASILDTNNIEYKSYDTFIPKTNRSYNHMTFIGKTLNQVEVEYAITNVSLSKDRLMVSLTKPLQSTPHLTREYYDVRLNCTRVNDDGLNESHVKVVEGISVSNYEIIFRARIPNKCQQILAINRSPRKNNVGVGHVQAFGRRLAGNLDKFCSSNVDAQINVGDHLLLSLQYPVSRLPGQKQDSSFLNLKAGISSLQKYVGDLLADNGRLQIQVNYNEAGLPYIEMGGQKVLVSELINMAAQKQGQDFAKTGRNRLYLARVQRVAGQDLYQLNVELPKNVTVLDCSRLTTSEGRKLEHYGQISSPSKLEASNQPIHNVLTINYNGSNIVKAQSHAQLNAGQEYLCMQATRVLFAPHFLMSFGLTLGQKFTGHYYEMHPWIEPKFLQELQQLSLVGPQISCVRYSLTHGKGEQTQPPIREPAQVRKLGKENDRLSFGQACSPDDRSAVGKKGDDVILSITLAREAVVQLRTVIQSPGDANKQGSGAAGQKGQRNQYFLTNDKIYKVETILINGSQTKVERLENSLYENSTSSSTIIIYKGIWRAGDFLKFPRYIFQGGEKITDIVIKYGHAYIRLFDLTVLDRESFAISSSFFEQHRGFGPRRRPSKSVATEYRFKYGHFCGGGINKNREALVQMRCGQSWFKLESISETAPCSYLIKISTQYLCSADVVMPALKQGFNIYNGTICLAESAYQSQ